MKNKCLVLLAITVLCASTALAQSKTPTFARYRVRVSKPGNISVDLKSHKRANTFRTNLRNAAKAGVNFAGNFVLANWGCGTNCSETAIIDARTGKVFFPAELEGAGFGFCELPDDAEPIVYKPDSRLLILNGFKGGDLNSENSRCGVYYLEWTGTNFRQVGFVRKKRLEMP